MLFFNKKKKTYSSERESIVRKLEQDVRMFVVQELITYKQNADNKTLGDSVIVNIALFDLSALSFEDGIEQMKNLLSDHLNQLVNRRMKQLLHTLYIRYGIDTVDDIANDSLLALAYVYKVDSSIIADLDDQFNIFWLVPFIREAYFLVMQGHDSSEVE